MMKVLAVALSSPRITATCSEARCAMNRQQVGPAVQCPHCECLVSLADVTRPGERASRTATCRGCAGSFSLAAAVPARRTLSTLLPSAAASAGAARAFTSETTRDWGLGAITDDATLIVSELVTNALVHTIGPVLLSLDADDSRLRIEVRDDSRQHPHLSDALTTAEQGRGLMIVAATADKWGVVAADVGKVVWANVLLHRATAA